MKCIIVDDEPLARRGLLLHLQAIGGIEISEVFNSADKALEYLAGNQTDLIFLDIEMPGLTGLEFAAKVPKETLIIFTTAFPQYAFDSYSVDAIDYLLKPISQERLEKALQKATAYHQFLNGSQPTPEKMEKEFMIIKADRRYHKITYKNILYLEGLKDFAVIHLENNKIIAGMNLKTVHELIASDHFMRVSKSFVVNTEHITSFDAHTIYINTIEIPIGEVYKKDFVESYLGKNLPPI